MEPIFVYFDKVPFDNSSNSKTFTLTFSDGDVLDGVFFRKTKDYYLTSMSSSITIEQVYVIKKIVKIASTYMYWISEEGQNQVIPNRFFREELFALNNQFL